MFHKNAQEDMTEEDTYRKLVRPSESEVLARIRSCATYDLSDLFLDLEKEYWSKTEILALLSQEIYTQADRLAIRMGEDNV